MPRRLHPVRSVVRRLGTIVPRDPAAQVALLGLAYAGAYVAATLLLAAPAGVGRVLLAELFLFLPGLAAALCAARAARLSREAERSFWLLLCAAAAANAASHALFAAQHAWRPRAGALLTAAHLGYYGYLVLLTVSLLVRPERPRTLQQVHRATLESLMAVVLGYFLVLYVAVLPQSAAQRPWYVVMMAQEALPLACALLAARTPHAPYRRIYGILAAGLGLGALAAAYPNWLHVQGGERVYSAWDAARVVPLLAVAAAARLAPAAGWLRAPWVLREDAPRALPALAVAVPPLLDLVYRAVGGGTARLAGQRTWLALTTAAVLSLLAAARLRRDATLPPPHLAEADEARVALGEPNAFLQFASGVAHELNNPLTAVSGWAELALHGGGEPGPLKDLVQSTRAAAEVVQQLQRMTRAAGEAS